MNDEPRRGVGFFRGLLAVLRGVVHVTGKVISLFGRGLAAITRRSHRTDRDVTRES